VLVLVVLLALAPVALLAPLFLWARSLRRRGVHRVGVWTAYVLIAVGVLVTSFGVLFTVRVMAVPPAPVDPSQKARALAEGISEAMNCGAFVAMLAAAVAVWLAVWRWRTAQPPAVR